MEDLTDLDRMIALLNHFGFEFSIQHSPPVIVNGKAYAGASTIIMRSDSDHLVHFYFDLREDGGKVRGVRPTIF